MPLSLQAGSKDFGKLGLFGEHQVKSREISAVEFSA